MLAKMPKKLEEENIHLPFVASGNAAQLSLLGIVLG